MSPVEEGKSSKRIKGTVVRRTRPDASASGSPVSSARTPKQPAAKRQADKKAATTKSVAKKTSVAKKRPATSTNPSTKATPAKSAAANPAPTKSASAKTAVTKSAAAKQSAAAKKTGQTGSAKRRPVTASKTAGGTEAQRRTKRRRPADVPEPGVGSYFAPFEGGRSLAGLTGALTITGTLLIVIAGYLTYISIGDTAVQPPVSVWSIIAHVLIAVLALVAGGALIAGRGGRAAITAVVPLFALAPGSFVSAMYDGAFTINHPGLEYYFGTAYETTTLAGQTGRLLSMIGSAVLIVAAIVALAAWRAIADADLIPLDGARRIPAGAAIFAAVLAIVALLLPSGLTVVQKYTDASGFELTRDIETPASAVSLPGWALVGGVLLIAGWLVAGAFAGTRITRTATVAGLGGLTVALASAALLNLRDVSAGPDLTAGPRFYLLAAGTLVAIGGAVYAATARVAELDDDPVAELTSVG